MTSASEKNYSFNNNPPDNTNIGSTTSPVQSSVKQKEKNYTNLSPALKGLEKTLQSPTSSAAKFINSVKHLLVRISFVFQQNGFGANRALDSYRTQEHLIMGDGSFRKSHNSTLLKAFQSVGGENFTKLHKEYKKIIQMPHDLNPGITAPWVSSTRSKLEKLEVGESLWINCFSASAGHAVMIRIEKRENSFNLHLANTGMGIRNNPDFHPSTIKEDGSKTFQIVAEIQNISTDNLVKGDFLKNFANAFVTGSNSNAALKGPSETLKNEKSHPIIDALYSELRVLINDGANFKEADVSTYKREQLTGSCGASCTLAMARTYLNEEESRKMNVDMQVKSLVKHYKQIESGKDTSSTRKIMVLDLIQSLKKEFSGEDLRLLEDIELKVKDLLKMHNAELKISTSSRVDLNTFIKKSEGDVFELRPFKAQISKGIGTSAQQNSKLVANARISKDGAANFQYQVKKNENGQWEGVDLNDKIALISFHIANGDHEQTDVCMNALIKELNKPHPKIELSDEQYQKQYYTEKLLVDISDEFRKIDNTRSGIAKQLFLSALALDQFCKRNEVEFHEISKDLWRLDTDNVGSADYNRIKGKTDEIVTNRIIPMLNGSTEEIREKQFNVRINGFGDARNAFCEAKKNYANLEVEKYLDEDNIWLRGLTSINALQPTMVTSQPPHNSEMHHISELLGEASGTVGSANEIALSFLQAKSEQNT